MKYYLRVMSNLPDPLHCAKGWGATAINNFICGSCLSVLRSRFPEPFDILLDSVPNGAAQSVWGPRISVFHVDFLSQVYGYMKDFVIGNCYDLKQNLLLDYKTVYAKDYIIVRGGKSSKYDFCKKCGNVNLFPPPKQPHYILLSDVSDSLVCFDSSFRMYIEQEFASKLDFSRWPYTEFDKIPVYDKPIDDKKLIHDSPSMLPGGIEVSYKVSNEYANLKEDNIGFVEHLGSKLIPNKAVLKLDVVQSDACKTHGLLTIEIDEDIPNGWALSIVHLPLTKIRSLNELTDSIIHFDDYVGLCSDDTSGAMPDELLEKSGLFFGDEPEKIWLFEGVRLFFEFKEDSVFKINLTANLYNMANAKMKSTCEAIVYAKVYGVNERN